jgi:hypothetical protein
MNTPDLEREPSEFAERDAIHVAIIPCVAGVDLVRGQMVDVVNGVAVAAKSRGIGVVNPFCERGVISQGIPFWLFLNPNTVTGIRHHWAHPIFDAVNRVNLSEVWLRHFALRIGLNYEDMIVIVRRYCEGGPEWIQIGSEEARTAYRQVEEMFWNHIGKVTGLTRPVEEYDAVFSCSC